MSHHHHHRHERSNSSSIEQDENAVTKWLNKMEASMASPKPTFSISDFTPKEIKAINTYMHSHEKSLARYDQFLPRVQINDSNEEHKVVDKAKDKHKDIDMDIDKNKIKDKSTC